MRTGLAHGLSFFLFVNTVATSGISAPGREEEKAVRDSGKKVLDRLKQNSQPQNQSPDFWAESAGKCGLRVRFDVLSAWESLQPDEKIVAYGLLTPVQMQADTVIGRFRVHFDTTNVNGNEPALLDGNGQRIPGTARQYVDSVGFYFNRVWESEVDSLGYEAPPFEQGESAYNIYVRNLGSFLYGQTSPYPPQPINPGQSPPRFTSFIDVHKDFQPFFSRGMKGLKVTAAHEFHHAIQLGSYGFRTGDLYFYEITSTWMEDVLFNDVNDYYQYITTPTGLPRGHFDTPERSLSVATGFIEYSRAIWGKYIEKRFSRDLMRRVWELMRQQASLPALNVALREYHSSLPEAYNEFSVWNFFTSVRADTTAYYTEGRNYPLVRLRDSLRYFGPLSIFTDSVQSLGATYFHLTISPGPSGAVFPIVIKHSVQETAMYEAFQYLVRETPVSDDYVRLFTAGGQTYWAKISGVRNSPNWTVVHATDTSILKSGIAEVAVYPNPLYLPEQGWIRFQPPSPASSAAALYVFSSSVGLIYSAYRDLQPSLLSSPSFVWDGRGEDGRLAPSGIYFYVLLVDGEEYKGKFTIIRK